MASYKLVSYQSAKGPRAGVVVDDKLFDAAALTRKAAYASVLDILNDWSSAKGTLKKASAARRQEQVEEPAAGQGQAACPCAVAVGDLLRRRQLHRPHDGDGQAAGHPAARPIRTRWA